MLYIINSFLILLLQVQGEIDFVSQLYNLSPIIGCLVTAIIFLVKISYTKDKKITEKEAELKELNNYIRESDSENIKILERVSSTLDKVMEQEKNGNVNVLKEIDHLKQIILLKINK